MTALDTLIAEHRDAYRSDLLIERLVARQPPTTLDLNTGALHVEDGAAIGMTISGRFLKYLGHPEGYGGDFPWSRSLYRLRWHCRKEHPYHRSADRPYWRGALCHQLVIFTVIREFSILNAARILRYDNPEPVLRYALSYMEATIDDFRAKAEQRARDEAGRGPGAVPAPEWSHHAVPGLHAEECGHSECVRRRAA